MIHWFRSLFASKKKRTPESALPQLPVSVGAPLPTSIEEQAGILPAALTDNPYRMALDFIQHPRLNRETREMERALEQWLLGHSDHPSFYLIGVDSALIVSGSISLLQITVQNSCRLKRMVIFANRAHESIFVYKARFGMEAPILHEAPVLHQKMPMDVWRLLTPAPIVYDIKLYPGTVSEIHILNNDLSLVQAQVVLLGERE